MIFSHFRIISCGCLILILLHAIQSKLLTNVLDTVGNGVGDAVNGISGDSKTIQFCRMNTSEFISYYNYIPEEHKVIRRDKGYVLTLFRCNSRKQCPGVKKVVIIQHGMTDSSDDFVVNPPDRGLVYILADECYDVWLPNSRGNYYSKENLEDWNFSWDDMAFEDFPLIFDYIEEVTKQTKFYFVAHSQGGSSVMALLSEYPDWNDRLYAVDLMAPAGFVGNSKVSHLLALLLAPANAKPIPFEMLPRSGVSKMLGSGCKGPLAIVCTGLLNVLVGPSDYRHTDQSMVSTYSCILPSGISSCQAQHYAQESSYHYFGRRLLTPDSVPVNFQVDRITVPLQLHYSENDALADKAGINRLIPMLTGAKDHLYLHEIDEYNHGDFIHAIDAHRVLYPKILSFFAKYTD